MRRYLFIALALVALAVPVGAQVGGLLLVGGNSNNSWFEHGGLVGGVDKVLFDYVYANGTAIPGLATIDTSGNVTSAGSLVAPTASAATCANGHSFGTASGVTVYSGPGNPGCSAAEGSVYLSTNGTTFNYDGTHWHPMVVGSPIPTPTPT